MYQRPDLLKHILEVTAQTTAIYLNERLRRALSGDMIFLIAGAVYYLMAYSTVLPRLHAEGYRPVTAQACWWRRFLLCLHKGGGLD